MQKKYNSQIGEVSRRTLLAWSAPTVTAMVLPAHAQTSLCVSMPALVATAPSKCSGVPPVGEAVLSLTSDAADPNNPSLEITAIAVTGDMASDTVTLPGLPALVTNSTGIDIQWTGSATDAITCLPLSDIMFEVTFRCDRSPIDNTVTFNMTSVLSAALP